MWKIFFKYEEFVVNPKIDEILNRQPVDWVPATGVISLVPPIRNWIFPHGSREGVPSKFPWFIMGHRNVYSSEKEFVPQPL